MFQDIYNIFRNNGMVKHISLFINSRVYFLCCTKSTRVEFAVIAHVGFMDRRNFMLKKKAWTA